MNVLLLIVLGGIAGLIASMLMKSAHSALEDIILGIAGAVVGGYVLSLVGMSGVTGFDLYSIGVAVIGAVVLIWIGRMIHR